LKERKHIGPKVRKDRKTTYAVKPLPTSIKEKDTLAQIRLQEKGFQSRSATASLLKKNYQCMKEEIKLIVFMAQKSTHC